MIAPEETNQPAISQLIAYVNEQIELLAFDEPAPKLLEQMVDGLADPRPSIRLSLIEAFGQIGEPATPFLMEGLAHQATTTARQACCHALSNIGDPQAVSGLVQALRNDTDIVVKGAAATALASVGQSAFAPLCEVLASETADASCKGQAAWAIASMSSEISEQLYDAVNDPSPTVRTAVIGAIAQLARQHKDPKASKTIRQALSDPSSEVRIEAAADLARLNDQDAYQILVKLLTDPDAEVRKSVILALGKFDREGTIQTITPLIKDPSPQVQRVATLVVTQLQSQTK
ncbi:MAG: HEAT repeat domain-containing protein [Cyanobacteria bacterium P01_D01_bin.105]